jgi:hypothetical protein
MDLCLQMAARWIGLLYSSPLVFVTAQPTVKHTIELADFSGTGNE